MIELALAALGAVLVPVNTALSDGEAAYLIGDADVSLRLSGSDADESAALTWTPLDDFVAWRASAGTLPTRPPAENDPFAILYTSGTTGRPKGVLIPQASYPHSGVAISERIAGRSDDRFLVILPLFHVAAQQLALFPALVSGASAVLRASFSASTFWADVRTHGITAYPYVAMIQQVLWRTRHKDDRINSVRVAAGGGMGAMDREAFEAFFGMSTVEVYGQTETGAVAAEWIGQPHRDSAGTVVVQRELRIRHDSTASAGEPGEILARGHGTMIELWHNPAVTAARKDLDGWISTGDLGTIDADGHLRFCGRVDDRLKVRGENVTPDEVEAVILDSALVADVAVIGLPDDVQGHIVVACVVPLAAWTTEVEVQLRRWCSERLAAFKHPQRWEPVVRLPRTATNKVQRRVLIDALRDESVDE